MEVVANLSMWGTTSLLATSTFRRARAPVDAALLVPTAWLALLAFPSILPVFRGASLAFHAAFEGDALASFFLAASLANLTLFTFQWFQDHQQAGSRQPRLVRDTDVVAATSVVLARYWFVALLALAITLALLHWFLMPSIPLWNVIQNVEDPLQVAIDRENSAKLLAAPTLLKYVFVWNGRILFPILICAAVLYGWRKLSVVAAIIGLVYLMSTMEKMPSMLFALAPFLALAVRQKKRLWSPLLVVGLFVSLLPPFLINQSIPISASVHSALAGESAGTRQPQAAEVQPFDANRAARSLADLVFRRIGAGPSEVTYSWFAYFPAVHGGFLNGAGWAPWNVLSSQRQSPANLVGLWAYYGRPGYDLPSLSAYASFIADGWAEFSYLGVALVCIALFLTCTMIEWLRRLISVPFLLACYAPGLLLVAVMPPQGGVPAMLFSLGLVFCPLISLGYLASARIVANSPRLRALIVPGT